MVSQRLALPAKPLVLTKEPTTGLTFSFLSYNTVSFFLADPPCLFCLQEQAAMELMSVLGGLAWTAFFSAVMAAMWLKTKRTLWLIGCWIPMVLMIMGLSVSPMDLPVLGKMMKLAIGVTFSGIFLVQSFSAGKKH